jgi:hypothetical protein
VDNVTLDSQSRATSRHTTEEPNSTFATNTKIRASFISDEKCVVLHDSEEIIMEGDVINAVRVSNLKVKVYFQQAVFIQVKTHCISVVSQTL